MPAIDTVPSVMTSIFRKLPSAFSLTLVLAACSSEPEDRSADTAAENVAQVAAAAPASPPPAVDNTAEGQPTPQTAPRSRVVGLEGLGNLRVGHSLPQDGNWAPRGAQIEGGCQMVSSPDYPGVYAIVAEGKVRRITIGQRSDVKLVEGVGVGSSEDAVRDSFRGFREEAHKYEESPAKYLTTPGADRGGAALRFEIGRNRKVGMFHVGTMPVLGYVEGCA